MAEVIAAIVGVLLGAALSWWFTRYRPHFVVCENPFMARLAIGNELGLESLSWSRTETGFSHLSMDLGLPNTKILVGEKAVDALTVHRLKLRNMGNRLVAKAKVQVTFREGTSILTCDVFSVYEQHYQPNDDIGDMAKSAKEISQFATEIEKNELDLVLPPLYPYLATRQVMLIDVICTGETGVPTVLGQGTFEEDRTVWTIKYEPWEVSQQRINRRVNRFNRIALIGLLIATVPFLILRPPVGLFTINTVNAVQWVSQPAFLILVGLWALFLGYAFYFGMRGWTLSLPMPFLGRRLRVYFARVGKRE